MQRTRHHELTTMTSYFSLGPESKIRSRKPCAKTNRLGCLLASRSQHLRWRVIYVWRQNRDSTAKDFKNIVPPRRKDIVNPGVVIRDIVSSGVVIARYVYAVVLFIARLFGPGGAADCLCILRNSA